MSEDESEYSYWSEYSDDEADCCSVDLSPYSSNPLPALSQEELSAARELQEWLQGAGDLGHNLLQEEEESDEEEDLEHEVIEEAEAVNIIGERDVEGRLHGECEIHYSNGDYFWGHLHHGCKQGEASLVTRAGDEYQGRYHRGLLAGRVTAQLAGGGGGAREACYRAGRRHGLCREVRGGQLLSLGRYRRGGRAGTWWTRTKGGSYLVGEVVPGQDGEYRHHGEVVFLYPDLVTALAGQWVEGRLARGRQVRVAGLRWAGGVAQLVTRPAPGAAVVSYQPAGSLCISRSPLVRDPYEVRHVYVAPSRASEAAGEGLFAKTALGPGCLVALFNGVRQRVVAGTRDTRAWSDYRIECGPDTDLDILPGQEQVAVYCATLAHKVNNSFNNNCRFAQFWHPRFGNIMSIVAVRAITAGEELFVCYNYRLDQAPPWYRDLWHKHCHGGD